MEHTRKCYGRTDWLMDGQTNAIPIILSPLRSRVCKRSILMMNICDYIMDSLQENMSLGCDRFMCKQMQSDLRLYYGTVLNVKTVSHDMDHSSAYRQMNSQPISLEIKLADHAKIVCSSSGMLLFLVG